MPDNELALEDGEDLLLEDDEVLELELPRVSNYGGLLLRGVGR